MQSMEKMLKIAKITLLVVVAILVGVPLYAVLATVSLPPGPRPGIEELTIAQAVQQLRQTGKSGWVLVEAARAMVAKRMQYCRRNSFDTFDRAFKRGYGYCQQQAYALTEILKRLGFEAKVVQAFQNKLPDGTVGGHAWVSVTHESASRYIDSIHYDAHAGEIMFTPLTKVWDYTPVTRVFFGWGCAMVNAHRYYMTGKDR
jgi:hypothetical protein